MATAGGLKHVSTEPAPLANKRERRRGASGRAAALRRAPSDSDCSGETASLSADSGERRPLPPKPGKTRSRRRGSEWEVLEGLKDGQRYDRRPEVFNGYLHKKRKWPLKGWHKRFFVVDGGILVYARSPTDVARGRLHGSVDVGLSVISAKARRRRIDIDADEFIYHLRAKTADVFRTWLNVLKVHRLYRQHLLTFGARESTPKAIEDSPLPPTETSSRTESAIFLSTTSDEASIVSRLPPYRISPDLLHSPMSLTDSLPFSGAPQLTSYWSRNTSCNSDLLPLKFDTFETVDDSNNPSLCSIKHVTKKLHNQCEKLKKEFVNVNGKQLNNFVNLNVEQLYNFKYEFPKKDSRNIFLGPEYKESWKNLRSTPLTSETQVRNMDYDTISSKSKGQYAHSQFLYQCSLNTPNGTSKISKMMSYFKSNNRKVSLTESNYKFKPKGLMYLCSSVEIYQSSRHNQMRRSKKCTNLKLYKNVLCEPTLRNPMKKGMLLGEHDQRKQKPSKSFITESPVSINIPDRVQRDKHEKWVQDTVTVSDCDKISASLMMGVLKNFKATVPDNENNLKEYIEEIINELYGTDTGKNVAKLLVRSLLQYWLQNTSLQSLHDIVKIDKTTDKPSNICFTKDQNMSGIVISSVCKETQHGICLKHLEKFRHYLARASLLDQKSRKDSGNSSIDKERRIRELEALLNNTLDICETICSTKNMKRDLQMSNNSSNNLGDLSRNYSINISSNGNEISVEHSKVRETITYCMNEGLTNKLLDKRSSTQWITGPKITKRYSMVTESNCKIMFQSKTTGDKYIPSQCKPAKKYKVMLLDNAKQTTSSEKMYLKNLLNTITKNHKKPVKSDNRFGNNFKDEELKPVDRKSYEKKVEFRKNHLVVNSVVTDISKCNLNRISTLNNSYTQRSMSITNRKDNKPNMWGLRCSSLCVKFSNIKQNLLRSYDIDAPKLEYYRKSTISSLALTRKTVDSRIVSSSDLTSKGFGKLYREKVHSAEFTESNNWSTNTYDKTPCYVISSIHKKDRSAFNFDDDTEELAEKQSKIKQISPPKATAAGKQLVLSEKPNDPMINEEFILLLLENVTLLSKAVPTFHADISALYKKLKERHKNKIDYETKLGLGTSTGVKSFFPRKPADTRTETQNDKHTDKIINQNTRHFGITDINEVHKQTERDMPKSKSMSKSVLTRDNIIPVDKEIAQTTEKYVLVKSFEKLSRIIDKVMSSSSMYSSSIWRVQHEPPQKKTGVDKEIILCKKSSRFPSYGKFQVESDEKTSTRFEWPDRYDKKVSATSKACTNNKNHQSSAKNLSRIPVLINEPQKKYEIVNDLTDNHKQTTQKSCSKAQAAAPTKKDKNKAVCKKKREFKLLHLFFGKIFMKPTFCSSKSSSVLDSNLYFQGSSNDLNTIYRNTSNPSFLSDLISPTSPPIRGPQAGFVSGTPGGRLASWIVESGGPLETVSRELGQAQLSVQQLQRLLDSLELHQTHHDTDSLNQVSLEGASPNVKKDRRKFGLRKKKSNSKCSSIELGPTLHIDPSSSHSTLSTITAPPSPGGGASSMPTSASSLPMACGAARPQSLPAEALAPGPAPLSLTPDHLREDFTVLAKDLVHTLNGVVTTLICERGRLRAAMDAAEGAAPQATMVTALRTNLNTALQQNSELRSRLSRIHDASDIADVTAATHDVSASRPFHQSLSFSSSCVSASEFFDAEEHEDEMKTAEILPVDEAGVIELDGDSSSEAGSLSSHGSEASASSENSDPAMLSAEPRGAQNGNGALTWSRRTTLPSPRPTPGGPSLWNLLYKNIGKDLSQISMPVTINEPLNMLQRLCEELEYSELLDSAAQCSSGVERMALIAAFAVSAYAAAAHRAASKPFNPLLAETYECVRDDRSFRFIAEQVSHHPPVSACHADSPAWSFWQEARIKTKFWGKSMEFQPAGRVHVRLNTTGDHYSWNKVTTCVHNLFGGQRWVDQYGEMTILCHGTQISCKLNFVKASSWSSSRHEVRGAVTDGSTGARLRLQGRWSEALYAGEPPAARCLWRPGAMPPDHEQYYGFTRFAMELNELEPGLRRLLPPTDTRLRPDQRALEEGAVEAAEQYKLQLEQTQRERRRDGTEHAPQWFRKTVSDGEEMWVFGGEYWKAREAGYAGHTLPTIW